MTGSSDARRSARSGDSSEPPIRLTNVERTFAVGPMFRRRRFAAVDSVSVTINARESVGLVGESGCGKSTLARLVLMLDRPTSGQLEFHGTPYGELSRRQRAEFHTKVQAVFQDPYTSLNPAHRIETVVSEPARHFGRSERKERVLRAMASVGLPDPAFLKRRPHQFSGGQRQRIAIARAIVTDPQVIVLDEPTSALDVSMRAQVLNLLLKLREEYSSAFLLISHDILAVRHIADRILVMYLGEVVEEGPGDAVVTDPLHPYTRMLVDSMADDTPLSVQLDEVNGSGRVDLGEVPNPLDRPPGCRFHPRCPEALEKCRVEEPLRFTLENGRKAVCWLYESEAKASEHVARFEGSESRAVT